MRSLLMLSLVLAAAAGAQTLRELRPAEAAPGPRDHTRFWWADGWRGEPVRWVETGWYGFALNTRTLAVPHFGCLGAAADYAGSAAAPSAQLAALPGADLRLTLTADGRVYRAIAGGAPGRHTGPRLIESGRYLARGDLTDLVFAADDGTRLPVEARLETIAWPDRLTFWLEASPAQQSVAEGPTFGRVGGGMGFDAGGGQVLPPASEGQALTWECWVYVPAETQPTKAYPWLLCAGGNEWSDGHYGLTLIGGAPRAQLDLGGGRENSYTAAPQGYGSALSVEAWHHLAATYDGQDLILYVDGRERGRQAVGRARTEATLPLTLGRRGDGSGDGYHFGGVLDEVRVWRRALSAAEIAAHHRAPEAVRDDGAVSRAACFDPAGPAALKRPAAAAKIESLGISLTSAGLVYQQSAAAGPVTLSLQATANGFVQDPKPATDPDAARGWRVVDLNQAQRQGADNDVLDVLPVALENPGDQPLTVRLLLRRDRAPMSITGLTPLLLDRDGRPSGLPVQVSKNWHRADGQTLLYEGPWLHAASLLRLPPRSRLDLRAALAYAHWGGVAAASHAQLCLIGWGSNQQWDQAALGSWGESFCFEPDQAQAETLVCDVRPTMVLPMSGQGRWNWTGNVGGGDVLRLFDPAGRRVFPRAMRSTWLRQGPVLTEVTYAGRTAGLSHATTVQMWRTDDINRCLFRLSLRAEERVPLGRLTLFQVGADTYNSTSEQKMACGNAGGLLREWATQWGGDVDRGQPVELSGEAPWVSLHEAVPREKCGPDGWANRGYVVRAWDAVLGGRPARPWLVERGQSRGNSSTADLRPPPGVTELLPGDHLEAIIEYVVIPQTATGYYGPNKALAAALAKDQNTWRMVWREATQNTVEATVTVGRELRRRPLRLAAAADRAEFVLRGGLGYVPVTVAGLTRPGVPRLEESRGGAWQVVDQSHFGNDFWQAEPNGADGTWEITYSLPADTTAERRYRFALTEK